MKYTDKEVFEIGLPGARAAGSAADMGFKAFNLARMAHIGLKVPEAFVLGTAICRDFLKHPARSRTALYDLLVEMLRRLESASRLSFGGIRKPLLVSVRSGAPVAMPGMMDTLLNIGLCDATLHGLIRLTGNSRLAWDSYRRLVQQFAEVVHGADAAPFRADDADRLQTVLPEVWAGLNALRSTLEWEFRDAQEFEFTVQDGELFLLQTRDGKRTPWAALRIAVDQVAEGLIDPMQALTRLDGIDLERLERRHLASREERAVLGDGVPAGLGLAGGAIALDVSTAQRLVAEGRPALLVREDALSGDIAGLAACEGLLAARGSRVSHAAVVARELGKPCLVGCEQLAIDRDARTISFGRQCLKEGDLLWIDAEAGLVLARQPAIVIERPVAALATVADWRRGEGDAPLPLPDDAGRHATLSQPV